MNLEEKWLIIRFNRGDLNAVHMIYELTKHDLLALAVSLLRDTAAAEDVVHDVFASFLKLPKFQLTGSLKGYLSTCVANAARNILRANHRHPSDPLDEAAPVEAGSLAPDLQAIETEEQRLLGRALQNLPYEQREVVMLHLRGGLKFAEIAQAQQVSINTVQGRYRYGLDKVRTELAPLSARADSRPPLGAERGRVGPSATAGISEEHL